MDKRIAPKLTGPSPLKAAHKIDTFNCGEPSLDNWLRERAPKSEGDTARTFVVCRGRTVVGYYSLAAGAVLHSDAPGALKRNAPNPVPVLVLARLAVDVGEKGKGLGPDLLAHALKRAVAASRQIGIRAVVVHAIDDARAGFYEKRGFKRMSPGSLVLYLAIATIVGGLVD